MKLEVLQRIALSVTQARNLQEVLRGIVDGLDNELELALTRIWLARPGDICESCPMAAECQDQSLCLHLVASQGKPKKPGTRRLERLTGRYRRFPLGVRKIGTIAADREPLEIVDVTQKSPWIVEPDWVQREGIRSFVGHRLEYQGRLLGVLAVFSRTRFGSRELEYLRTFSEHAAIAIENARSREEIAVLTGRLEQERDYLREEVREVHSFGEILGESPAIQTVKNQIGLVAQTDANVLLLGESGTGKELAARAIHAASGRHDRSLVRVNCAGIPEELFESEFFGHVKGAFTGAHADRFGRFQLADGGTLFLDEIGEIPLGLQGKLLRVLQEGQFERVGDDRTRTVDVRVVAATNRDLRQETSEGRFREDLFYRLSVFPIQLPPLRDRLSDIPLLARFFLCGSPRPGVEPRCSLSDAQLARLRGYHWPGNIRELQNVLERALILTPSGPLRLDLALPPHSSGAASVAHDSGPETALLTVPELDELLRKSILVAFERSGGKLYGPGGAAELLGIPGSTLASRMKVLGINKPRRQTGLGPKR